MLVQFFLNLRKNKHESLYLLIMYFVSSGIGINSGAIVRFSLSQHWRRQGAIKDNGRQFLLNYAFPRDAARIGEKIKGNPFFQLVQGPYVPAKRSSLSTESYGTPIRFNKKSDRRGAANEVGHDLFFCTNEGFRFII